MNDLSDAEWVALDLLMRARTDGDGYVHRSLLLASKQLPDAVKIKLVMSLLIMSNGEYVRCENKHEFYITDAGAQLYQTRFGTPKNPTPKGSSIAQAVICLPYLPVGAKMQ